MEEDEEEEDNDGNRTSTQVWLHRIVFMECKFCECKPSICLPKHILVHLI